MTWPRRPRGPRRPKRPRERSSVPSTASRVLPISPFPSPAATTPMATRNPLPEALSEPVAETPEASEEVAVR